MRRAVARSLVCVLVLAGSAACGEKKGGADWGPYRIKVEERMRRADAAPCDAVAARELVQTLVEAGDLPTATARGRAFRAACKPDQKLAEVEADVAKRAADKAYAVEVAQVLVDLSPTFGKRRADLGRALDDVGDARALLEWRRAFALAPTDPGTADGLAKAHERAGNPCDALMAWIAFASFHKDRAAEAGPHMERLRAKPGCDAVRASGNAKLDQRSESGVFVFPMKLGGVDTELGMDFGAGYTTITSALAGKIGVKTEGAPELVVKTSAGQVAGRLVTIPSVQLGKLEIGPVQAVVVDKLGKPVQGMLGADVTTRLELERLSEKTFAFRAR